MDSKEAIAKYEKLLDSNPKYSLTGKLDIVSNEELYHYNVLVDYMEGDYYKAKLVNTENDHTQVILKNEDGVFVVTPSLNKSFKFQSDWPYNSSQVYILASLLNDIENDSEVVFEEGDTEYKITSTVNYPNNSSLITQTISFDKEMIPKMVYVYNEEGIANMTFTISEINFEPKFSEDHFEVSSTVEEGCCSDVTSLDEIVYPLYLPNGTELKSEETVKTDDSERIILTFAGEKSFILIEEASATPKEFEITPSNGEFVFYENIFGNLTDSSLSWSMNGKDYYIIGDSLTNEELLKIASSTSVVAATK